jgi:hypothetical protein
VTEESKLPWDIKQQCLWIVRGYERQRREYLRARREILDAGGEHYTTAIVDGEEVRAYMPTSHAAGRNTEDIAIRLAALESSAAYRQMRAVEHARARIGIGLPEGVGDALRDAIMLNCQNGRKYPFERLYVIGIGRSEFYRIRDQFFRQIAEEVGLY